MPVAGWTTPMHKNYRAIGWTICVPNWQPQNGASTTDMSTPAEISNQAVKILIAEDSPTQALQLQHILESQGYQVHVAANGRLALEATQDFVPTLVVSDVVMPEMDGYELSRRIKSDPG